MIQFTVKTKDILDAVKTVIRVVDKKQNGVEEHKYIRITCNPKEGTVNFTARNVDIISSVNVAITCLHCEAKISYVDYKIFYDYIKIIKDKVICVEIDDNYFWIKNRENAQDIRIQLKHQSLTFDTFVVDSINQDISFDGDEFITAVNQTAYATDKKGNREQFGCVNLVIKDNKATFITTDSYRLCKKIILLDNTKSYNECNCIIPVDAFVQASKVAKCNVVSISITDNYAIFTIDNTVIQCKLVKKEPLDFTFLFEREYTGSISVNVSEILDALNEIRVAMKMTNQIKISVVDDGIFIEENIRMNDKIRVFCKTMNKDGVIDDFGINIDYLTEALKTLDKSDIIEIMISETPSKIIQIKDKNQNITKIIVPVKL